MSACRAARQCWLVDPNQRYYTIPSELRFFDLNVCGLGLGLVRLAKAKYSSFKLNYVCLGLGVSCTYIGTKRDTKQHSYVCLRVFACVCMCFVFLYACLHVCFHVLHVLVVFVCVCVHNCACMWVGVWSVAFYNMSSFVLCLPTGNTSASEFDVPTPQLWQCGVREAG